MRKGDTAQFAIWYCEEDDPKWLADWKEKGCAEHMKRSADYFRVKLGPVRFYELEPGEGQAGHPPDGKRGTNFKLLVGEADVVGELPYVRERTWLQDLSAKDLKLLRNITRATWSMRNPDAQTSLSDEACDEVIELLGPEVTEKMIYEAANATKH